MKTKVISASNPFDGYFPDPQTESQRQRCPNILFRVCVSQVPPRDEQFEFQLDMGRDLIQPILEHKTFQNSGSLFFCFPERWMSQKEQFHFIDLLTSHPSIVKAKMTVVDMYTLSPLIVGNLYSEDLRSLSLKKFVDGLSPSTNKALSKIKKNDDEE